MRTLGIIIAVVAVVFFGAMGYYWMRDGSLQSAGAEMDKNLGAVDRATEPLQKELGDIGDATKETVGNATDGDDKT
jgi:hypothetical protein